MNCLVINALSKMDEQSNKLIDSLLTKFSNSEVFHANEYKIGACIGCTDCWLKTPGVCAVKDDWEIMFKKFLKSEYVIFITEAHLGFISHKMKIIVDRLIPLALPGTKICNGELRHPGRYNKSWKMGLVYSGNGNKDFLNEWMGRFTLNHHSKSLGAYSIFESEELFHEIDNI
jgi:multimeric flavodoxin WrbA